MRDPNSHPSLNQSLFPDLYYAAISYAKANKLLGDNFQMSSSHMSTHTLLIDRYIKKMASAELGELSEESKAKLMRLGYPVTASGKRRTRDAGSDDDKDAEEPAYNTFNPYPHLPPIIVK